MLSLFKSRPLLDESELNWLIETFVWAYEHFDGEYFSRHTRLVLPTNEFFPGAVSSVDEMARQVFGQVLGYAGMTQWPLALVAPSAASPRAFPEFRFGAISRGENAALLVAPPYSVELSYNPNQINQPQDLIASFAQGLATVLIYQARIAPPGGQDYIPQAIDVVASYLGFGVMLSNTAYQFKGGCGSCYNPYANRRAALNEAQSVFLLALVAHFKGATKVEKHLKPHLRSGYKQARKQLAGYLAGSANPLLLALDERQVTA